jgi:hypothetical protein
MVDPRRELDDRYRIQLFGEPGSVAGQAIVDLWIREGVMPAVEARRRLSEILFVAVVNETDEPVAVSTVYLSENELLRVKLWNYRTFVARDHRQSDLAWMLFYASLTRLEELHAEGADEGAAGVFMSVQSKVLRTSRDAAIWPQSKFAFVGESERGSHFRVRYFPDAVVA